MDETFIGNDVDFILNLEADHLNLKWHVYNHFDHCSMEHYLHLISTLWGDGVAQLMEQFHPHKSDSFTRDIV